MLLGTADGGEGAGVVARPEPDVDPSAANDFLSSSWLREEVSLPYVPGAL